MKPGTTDQPFAALDDDALMRLVCTSDPGNRAFAELVGRYQKKLINFFARLGASDEDEDLAQQTFLRLYNYRANYKRSAKLSTFLFLLARQVWIDAFRHRKRQEKLMEDLARQPHDEFTRSAASEVDAASETDLSRLVKTLPEGLRLVIELGIYQELPYREISKILDIPVGTVKSRMFNALALLRKKLHE